MKADFPEVRDFARIVQTSIFFKSATISYTDPANSIKTFNEEKICVADPSFLTMFSFPLISGDPTQVLLQPKSVVISETIAKKYFGKENPVGHSIVLNGDFPLKVTGVFKNVPVNSHIQFDFLISFSTLGDKWGYDNWTWPEYYTYVMLAPGTDPKKIEAKFPAFIEKYLGAKMRELNFGSHFHLQPVTDIHLKSNYLKEPEANGSARALYMLSMIGVFILVIAWINYVNLATVKSMERAIEVGLRKVVGASRRQLIVQFIVESLIINLIAVFVAAAIIYLFTPWFGKYTGVSVSGGLLFSGLLQRSWFWYVVMFIFVTSTFIVGGYPAFILSAFRPVLAIKGKLNRSFKGVSLRRVLVSFQFILAVILIAGSITVYKQLLFMRNQHLGYNQEQVLVIKSPAIFDSTINQRIDYFQTELRKTSYVNELTFSSDIPGKMIVDRNTVRKAGQDKTHNFITYMMQVDESFISTFQAGLLAGRNFLRQETLESNNTKARRVIINEEVVKALGYKSNEDAIGQQVVFSAGDEINGEIIGVMKNYHQRSLKEQYDPILYYPSRTGSWQYISVSIHAGNPHNIIQAIEKLYKKTFTSNAFEYFFLNDYFNKQYSADEQFGKVFGLFTILAILIACLGLSGLSSYVIKLRTKEIGIRKVLGASVPDILVYVCSDFVRLVLLASIIATPIFYLAAGKWLDNYAFRIQLSWFIFIIPPVLLLLITLITISTQSIKAAIANPVKSLRTE